MLLHDTLASWPHCIVEVLPCDSWLGTVATATTTTALPNPSYLTFCFLS